MENRLSIEDSRYLKTALKLLRQSKSMFGSLAERSDVKEVSEVLTKMCEEISETEKKINTISDYYSTDKFIQLSINFDVDEQ